MAIISCPPVYKKNKKQVESKNLLLTILFSKLFGNLAIRYNGNSEYTTAKKSQSHATILPFREFKPLENHALLLKTYQGASTNISSLGLAVTEMHNAKVEKGYPTL